MTDDSISARGRELLQFAEQLKKDGLNWTQAFLTLYNPGGRWSQLFPTLEERIAFAGSPEHEALRSFLSEFPENPEWDSVKGNA